MSYATARRQVIGIVEGITPTDTRIQGKFKHVAEAKEGDPIRERSFRVEANVDGDGGVTGPFTPDLSGQPRMMFPISVVVTYRDMANRAALDEVMASDYRDMAIALLKPSNWDRPASGLLSLTTNPTYLPVRRSFADGVVEQRIAASLWFN